MALLLPWYLFLFVGAFDWGIYAHSLVSVQSAARQVALYASQSSSTTAVTTTNTAKACNYALEELRIAPNVMNLTTCNALPVIVTYAPKTGAGSADGQPATEISVTYQTISLIPIPGLLRNKATFYRRVQMRLRS